MFSKLYACLINNLVKNGLDIFLLLTGLHDVITVVKQCLKCLKYDFGFMFAYSERPGTAAEKKMVDDIPLEVKKRRLAEVILLQQKYSCVK